MRNSAIEYGTPILFQYTKLNRYALANYIINRKDKKCHLVEIDKDDASYTSSYYKELSYDLMKGKNGERVAIGPDAIIQMATTIIEEYKAKLERLQKEMAELTDKYVAPTTYVNLKKEKENYMAKPENSKKENYEKVLHTYDKAIKRAERKADSMERKERQQNSTEQNRYMSQIRELEQIIKKMERKNKKKA